MKIRLIGQRNRLGIGVQYSQFCDHIMELYGSNAFIEEINFSDKEAIARAIAESTDDDINISFIAANIHEFFRGKTIQYIVFESDKIANHIMATLLAADHIWVPSTWGRKILENHKIPSKKISVVPEGVKTDELHPFTFDLNADEERRFRFLCVGKYELRKGIRETIQAFAEEFGKNPNVELYIKTGFYREAPEKVAELKEFADSFKLDNLIIYYGQVPTPDLIDLYRSSDIFVLASKGEGWGLPIIEAASCGLPIVTTYYSGQTEFLQYTRNSLSEIPYELGPIDCPEFKAAYPDPNQDYGNWAHLTVDNIRKSMRLAYTNHSHLKKNAVKNSLIIREKFNWSRSIDIALESVVRIQQNKD